MTTSSINSDNKPIADAVEQLQQVIELLIELGVLVHDNQGTQQSHAALTHKTNQLVSQLSTLSSNPEAAQYPIPMDVILYIEQGRNPDIYTREFVEVTAKSNARLKGKMEGFRKLRDVLGDKLTKEFPRLEAEVANIKQRTNVQTKEE